jgi:hypothetical protein
VMPRLYEPYATVARPLDLLRCCLVVFQGGRPPKQCSFRIREWIRGHGYCHRHAKGVKP